MMNTPLTPNPIQNGYGVESPLQSIVPVGVMESWDLCHHLACVVDYLVRVAHKDPSKTQAVSNQDSLRDLRQGERYLLRKISKERLCWNLPGCPPTPPSKSSTLTPEVLSKEWQLSSRLSEVLFYILTFQKLLYAFPRTRVICLKQALSHLRAEIAFYESLATPTRNQS